MLSELGTTLVVAGLLLSTGCGGGAPTEPRAARAINEDVDRYVSKEGQFSAIFPGKPELYEEPAELLGHALTIHTVGVAVLVPGEAAAYTVNYIDLPTGVDMLEAMREVFRSKPRVLISEKTVVVDGVKGLEIEFEEDVLSNTVRVFQVAHRYYQVRVAHKLGAKPPGTRRFLESFRLQ
jgi:hypothetical protein